MFRPHSTIKMSVLAFSSLFSLATFGQIETRVVKFPAGKTSTTINSSIKGQKTIDYAINAKKGQTLSVKLTTKNGANYFNLLPPGSNDVADFIGSSEGNTCTKTLSSSGVWKVRVYLERSEARRNVTANFTLNLALTGAGEAGAGAPTTGPKTFTATSTIRGHRVPEPYGSEQVDLGVIRQGNGKAEVHVNFIGANTRILFFDNGKWTCTSAKTTRSERSNRDEWVVILNESEVYIIPDAVITGG